jgi:nucleoside-diphosphate-sugar epimerase
MDKVVIILGLGFTGKRLANRLHARRDEVFAPLRGEWKTTAMPTGARMAVTIPPVAEPDKSAVRQAILDLKPERVVYVSSTGVYGDQVDINEQTPVRPSDERGLLRLEDENWYAAGPWSSLILRSSAIYGPNRGVHAALREGRLPRGSASGVVSRIHVDDLAALIEAGLYSELQGAWPVADEEPCSTAEIARWYAELSGLKAEMPTGPQVSGRRVDGREICKLLGVLLKYPTWQAGILASLEEEAKLPPKQ